MPSFPLSSKTVSILVEAIVAGNTATTMQTLFLRAEVDQWVAEAPNKEATAQLLLRRLREDGGHEARGGALELARLMLVRGKAQSGWTDPAQWWQDLHDAVAADGWEFDESRDILVPTVPGAVVTDEVSWIEAELTRRAWTTAAGHYKQAVDSFAAGNWAAANSQLRSFLESLICTAGNTASGSGSGQVQRAVDTLHGAGLLLPHEAEFVKSLWRLLHSGGSHSGLSDEDEARFRLLTITG